MRGVTEKRTYLKHVGSHCVVKSVLQTFTFKVELDDVVPAGLLYYLEEHLYSSLRNRSS